MENGEMKLSEDRIKQGILHPEQIVRAMALDYFRGSFCGDPTIMPLAIEAVQTYGWEKAFHFPVVLADLAQSEETLLWVIDQLNRMGRPANYPEVERCGHLSSIIARADIPLLMKQEELVLGLEGFDANSREAMAHRLALTNADTQSLWSELERFAEDCKDPEYDPPGGYARLYRMAEAIAADEGAAERVLDILSQKVERPDSDPMGWLHPIVASVAGKMRLAEAAPLLAARVIDDEGDVMNEQGCEALTRIGGQAALEAIVSAWPAAPWHFRLYTSSIFANLRTESAVPTALELLEAEKDEEVRENLIGAVLSHFSSEGIEPARQRCLRRLYELQTPLVAAATLMEIDFPEREKWRKEIQAHEKMVQRRMREWMSTPLQAAPKPKPAPLPPMLNNPIPSPGAPIIGKKTAGRNDPCPCGSGKKFKKCCG